MNRTVPLARTGFRQKMPAPDPTPTRGPKQRKCCVKACRAPFLASDPRVKWCGTDCGAIVAMERLAKQKAKLARADRAETKLKLKRRTDWVREAQNAWNAYVRARDAGKPCCSCGAQPEQKFGGTMDCSHYRSRGSAPHLKFHLHNAAAACTRCNRYLGGNVAALRVGLIERFGLARIEAVEADNTPRKFDILYLQRIKKIFTKKAKRLEGKNSMG